MVRLYDHGHPHRQSNGFLLLNSGVPHPGHPGATVWPKHQLPCRLEGLEILVWLEISSNAEDIGNSEGKQHSQSIFDLRRCSVLLHGTSLGRVGGRHGRCPVPRFIAGGHDGSEGPISPRNGTKRRWKTEAATVRLFNSAIAPQCLCCAVDLQPRLGIGSLRYSFLRLNLAPMSAATNAVLEPVAALWRAWGAEARGGLEGQASDHRVRISAVGRQNGPLQAAKPPAAHGPAHGPAHCPSCPSFACFACQQWKINDPTHVHSVIALQG